MVEVTRSPLYDRIRGADRGGALRHPRRRRGDRAAAASPAPGRARAGPRALGHLGALPRARGRAARCTARYVDAGCDVISTDTWSILSAPEVALRAHAGAPELGHWMDAARLAVRLARQAIDEQGREGECAVAFAISEEVGSPRARGARSSSCCARLRGGAAGPHAARDADSGPRPGDVRHGRATARDGAPGLAVLPPLPPRRVRRLRAALGPARGRPLRPRRAPLRGAGRRRAPRQLPADRPRPGDALVAARLHRSPARRLPEPRSSRRPALALRRRDRPGRVRGARARWRAEGAQIVGGCCGVDARSTSRRPPRRSQRRSPGASARRVAVRTPTSTDETPCEAVARRARAATLFPLPFPELVVDPGRLRPDAGQLPRLEAPLPRPAPARARAASTSAAAAGSSPSSSR